MKAVSPILTVFRRELDAYFNAAIAYIFIIVFILLNGGLFMNPFFLVGLADMRPFFGLLPFVLCIFLPAVTMRLWAEDRRGNTLELLLTFPMGTHQLVIGKFLAGLVFYAAALAGTFTIPIMMKFLGNPDFGAITGGYLGSFLLGAFFLSAGIFISGLCRDQIVAFILTMMVCFGLFLSGTEFAAGPLDGWVPGLGTFLRRFIGAAGHFESFAKGVADTRDVLYFVLGSALFLVLNGYWLEGRMKPGAKKIFSAAALIAAGIFVFGNWFISSIPLGRFDLTQGKIYTVAPATKQILRELKTPVLAKFYVSPADKMPTGMKTIEQDVIDKLDELRISSGGNFNYKIFHMEAANVAEEKQTDEKESLEKQLEKKGIQPFQVRAIESDEVAVRLVYSAITLAYKEKPEEMLPRVMPDNLNQLEYLIMSRIYRMTLDKAPKIAMVAPFQEKEMDPQLMALLAQLGGKMQQQSFRDDNYETAQQSVEYEGYEVERIDLSEEQPIPEGTKTLLIFEPTDLNDRQKYEINRFVRGGGSLFLAVQNFNFNYQMEGRSMQIAIQKNNPNVNSLLQSWGVTVDENILADEQSDVVNVNASGGGPFAISVPVKVPIQILVNEDGMNPDVSITSRLAPLFYLWGTALKLDDAKLKSQDLKTSVLLNSSHKSWTVPAPEDVLTPNQLERGSGTAFGPFPLAVMLEGQFADAFEGMPLPQWPAKQAETPEADAAKPVAATPPPVTPAPGKLILIGASSSFQNHLIRGGGHTNLLVNATDILTLGEALVTIRSKQPVDRAIPKISAPAKVAWKGFVIFLVPVILASLGTMRVLLRSRAKQNYLKTVALIK